MHPRRRGARTWTAFARSQEFPMRRDWISERDGPMGVALRISRALVNGWIEPAELSGARRFGTAIPVGAISAPASCTAMTARGSMWRVRSSCCLEVHDRWRECRNLTTPKSRIADGDGAPQHLRLCSVGVAC